jgi:raffinose/stachyose/melibiose transport system permease protein
MSINNMPTKKRKSARKAEYDVWIMRIALIILFIVFLYPIIFTVLTSLKSQSEFMENIWLLPKKVHWLNYYNAWVVGKIGEYFFNSVIVTTTSIICILLIASIAGYALARLNVPGANAIIAMLAMLLILPKSSLIVPLYMLLTKMRIIRLQYIPMIFAYVSWGIPFSVLILRNFFQSLPGELLEASKVEGCTEAQSMFKIAVPLMTPAIATCAVFHFCAIWGELMWAKIVTATTERGMTLPVGILFFKGTYITDWGSLTAGISIITIPLIILFICLQKYFVKGLTSSAVKG